MMYKLKFIIPKEESAMENCTVNNSNTNGDKTVFYHLIDKSNEVRDNFNRNMNGLLNFMFEGTYAVNVIFMNGNHNDPWFCGPDIARILGYSQANNMYRMLIQSYEITDVDVTNLSLRNMNYQDNTHGGLRHMSFISLAGVFKVINSSRRPEAREFQNWLYYEVLPSIYRVGYYASPNTMEQLEQNPELVKSYNEEVRQIKERNKELESSVQNLNSEVNRKNNIIDQLERDNDKLSVFFNNISPCANIYSEFNKMIDNRIHNYLEENNLL